MPLHAEPDNRCALTAVTDAATRRAESATVSPSADSEDPAGSPKVARHQCAEEIAASWAGAARSPIGFQFGCPRSKAVAEPAQRAVHYLLTCAGFRVATGRSFWQVARLQALQSDIRRSKQAFDLGKRGAKGIRTPDLLHAMQALYQLSYSPSGARG